MRARSRRSRRRTRTASPTRRRRTGGRHDREARAARPPPGRGAPLLRARPRAEPPLLHRAARLRRDRGERPRARARGTPALARCSRRATCGSSAPQPLGEGGRAWRYLRKHPDGVGTVVFEVEDVGARFRLLEERGGTPITDVQEHRDDGRHAAHVLHHDAARRHHLPLRRAARLRRRSTRGSIRHARPRGGGNAFGFEAIDHLTSNFQTMKPALLWMEHVLGLEELWEVAFHTKDAAEARRAALEAQRGSGLRSVVMRDPASGVKFANNEPWRPAFKSSQINVFNEDHRGDGIQHAALTVRGHPRARCAGCARAASSSCRRPAATTTRCPSGSRASGIGRIDEELDGAARARDPRGRRRARRLPAADLPARLGGALPRAGGGPVLLRDHPAQGRPGVRRRQLPRALRVDRARAAAGGAR